MFYSFLHNFWIIQSVGAVALLFGVIAWNSSTREKMLGYQSINAVLFIVHYFLLGAFSGAIMSGVTLLRNLVFGKQKENKWARSPMWLYVFILLSVAVVGYFWQGWPSILPVCGVMLGTYAVSRSDPKDIRFYMLLTILFWTPYTIIMHSYSGLMSQIISAVGIITGMVRLDRKRVEGK